MALFYNKKMVADAGLTDEQMGALTWNPEDGGTYEKAIAHLTVDKNGKRGDEPGFDKNNVAVYGFGFDGSGGRMGQTQWAFLTATPAGPTRTRTRGARITTTTTRSFQKTIAWYAGLADKGYMAKLETTVGASAADTFGAGKSAIDVNGDWMVGQYLGYKGIELGIAQTPVGPNGKSMSMYNGLADSIWAGTKSKAGAQKWVEYLASDACQNIVGAKGVVFPASKSGTEKAIEAFTAKGIDPTPFTSHVADKTTFLAPITDNGQKVDGIMTPAMDADHGRQEARQLPHRCEQAGQRAVPVTHAGSGGRSSGRPSPSLRQTLLQRSLAPALPNDHERSMTTLHLRTATVSLLLGTGPADAPQAEILHWGAPLDDADADLRLLDPPVPHSAFDRPVVAGLLPQSSSGWLGRPGLRGSRDGRDFSPALRLTALTSVADGHGARIAHSDPAAGLEVVHDLLLHDDGLLEVSAELRNTGDEPYRLDELGVVLPVPAAATELLDLSGRWCREQHPRRHRMQDGTWVRSGRHARTGHDSSLLVAVGTPGFANRSGRVWATHLAWSGDREQYLDALVDGRRMLGAAELLGSGEIVLAPGETYRTPAVFAAYSDTGLDGITDLFYRWFRARPAHPVRPRPVVLNTWEAVYFDHRLAPLVELADAAAAVGVERFVLDDGWFRGRIDDHRALGDWYVDAERWPDGLGPLIDAVRSRGMEFGLWVEPEMVNPDSDLARAHPEWISRATVAAPGTGGRLPAEWRHQQVLDLTDPDAWQYVYDRLDALLDEYDIAYLKWDQNRDLTEAGHAGRPSVHAQTLAVYRLIDALKAAHPTVEIESCASGGARVDLGILARTDRVWASDCNDARERQTIQRWTQAVLPPELVGSHIGPPRAHTTGRDLHLSFRAITALFGHLGVEWDIREADDSEQRILAEIIALYKQHRALLHTGTRVNADLPDDELLLHGVVSGDRSEALYAMVALGMPVAETPGRIGIPGLDPARRYRVQAVFPTAVTGDADNPFMQIAPPAWLADGAEASGSFLAEVGVAMPVLRPERALLLHVTAVG